MQHQQDWWDSIKKIKDLNKKLHEQIPFWGMFGSRPYELKDAEQPELVDENVEEHDEDDRKPMCNF